MKDSEYKILFVGLGKTGTSSFGTACGILGYKVQANKRDLIEAWRNKEYDKIWEVADKSDAFEDYPWPYIYKEFDEHYPNSKFVLGIRPNADEWVKSVVYQSLRGNPEHRKQTSKGYVNEFGYKYIVLHEKELKEMYIKHNNDVREYFKDRDDFLEISWWKGEGWKELCKFLDKPNPGIPFPFKKNAYPYPGYDRLRRMAMSRPERFFGW